MPSKPDATSLQGDIQRIARDAVPGIPVNVDYQYSTDANGNIVPVAATVTVAKAERNPAPSSPAVEVTISQEAEQTANRPIQGEEAVGRISDAIRESENGLNAAEREVVRRLQARDLQVRIHEAQHFRLAGGLASGDIQYVYAQGPDGKFYAVGGGVSVQTSATNDPKQAARDATSFALAAQAPADASTQDIAVANKQLQRAAALYQEAADFAFSASLSAIAEDSASSTDPSSRIYSPYDLSV